jgi:hypothetical protein
MDKKIAGLVGAISALAPMGATDPAAAKSVAEVLNPTSYTQLLQPIPNAVALLKAADEAQAARARAEAERTSNAQVAQWFYPHHHHHHHNNYWRRRYRHHHHHHHHNNYWRRYHHHHHNYYPGYYYPY